MHIAWQYSLNTNIARKNGIKFKERNRELLYTCSPLIEAKLSNDSHFRNK
jgi:hypothetical protein